MKKAILIISSVVLLLAVVVGFGLYIVNTPEYALKSIIEDVNDQKRTLKVMVKIFGRKTPLELNFMQVEKE